MADHPTVYLTNAASVAAVRRGAASAKTRACVGPGRVWTIMARPRPQYGEAGEGWVSALTPWPERLPAVRAGTMPLDEYRQRCLAAFRGWEIEPGGLLAVEDDPSDPEGEHGLPVESGDTLICACSREAAARGDCHRTWAAPLLVAAGWRVVLDGAAPNEDGVRRQSLVRWLMRRGVSVEKARLIAVRKYPR